MYSDRSFITFNQHFSSGIYKEQGKHHEILVKELLRHQQDDNGNVPRLDES